MEPFVSKTKQIAYCFVAEFAITKIFFSFQTVHGTNKRARLSH